MLLKKTIKFYIDSLYAEKKSPDTISNYSYNLGLLLKSAGDLPLQEISNLHVRGFLAGRAQATKASTVHQAFRVCRSFFNWCVREGFLEKTPMLNIKPPKIGRKVIKTYSMEEIHALNDQCNDKRFLGARNKAIIAVLLDTGIREGELVGLDVNNVDFRSGVIKVKGKGDKERIVKISDKSRKALNKYLFFRDDQINHVDSPAPRDRVFLSEEGRPMTGKGVLTTISRLGKAAGVKTYIHKFRDTCATEFLRAGGDLRTLQIMLGHENISTTAIYLSSMDGDDVIKSHMKFSPGDRFL